MNPKCANCRCYFIPQIKTSGLPYQTCEKCQLRVKNRYAFKTIKENTLEVYNKMTLTTKKIVKPKVSRSGKREIPVEPVIVDEPEPTPEPVPEPVPEVEEVAVEQPQEDIPFAELIGEIEPESQSALPPPVEKKKRVRKPKEIKEEYKAEIRAPEEPVVPTSPQVLEELVLPEEPAQEHLLFNHDKTKVFNSATKRWCKVDSKAGKKVVVV